MGKAMAVRICPSNLWLSGSVIAQEGTQCTLTINSSCSGNINLETDSHCWWLCTDLIESTRSGFCTVCEEQKMHHFRSVPDLELTSVSKDLLAESAV